jgi:UDP-3-O-acyl N-acetylglucosamine deacetylase
MHAPRQQYTISESAEVSGFGFWSGKDVTIEFRPAPPDTGIVFVRRDIASPPRIAAVVENRFETPRRTTLTSGGATVEMVEHILAACAGLQIDNCEIWVDQPEMPGCDGSSQPFVDALDAAGAVKQDALRPQLIVGEVTRVGDDESWVEAQPSPHGEFAVKYRLDYGSNNDVGRQTLEMSVTRDTFCNELAAARTFLLKAEADWLRARGLGARVSPRDVLVFDDDGLIDNELRFEDECVRHKTLDLVGDLALAGCDVVGKFVAHRSGHRLNAELVRALLAENQVVQQRRKTA